MATTLAEILDTTRRTLPPLQARMRELEAAAARAPVPPPFGAGLRGPRLGLVAEVKRRSPSAGAIRVDLRPDERAARYAAAGAAAISVLTDGPYFGGSLKDLESVARAVPVPVLRKDFILHEAQILEARAAGASAVLLIVRALEPHRLRELLAFARGAGLAALVEVHARAELDVALESDARVIGVNSRDLDTFRIDVDAAWALVAGVPADRVAVAESGMSTPADVERAAAAGADAVLIGTALSAADDPTALAAAFAGVRRRGR
ncbi:MAG TPA: indole-3-glycerol phosphate synthase TrpC [Gemmatimonadales bacterium]|nr:indole-3-glycerol phosphate synthase TrpC [Gemmatimonadales bacterium]